MQNKTYAQLLTWIQNNTHFSTSAIKIWQDETIAENKLAVALILLNQGQLIDAYALFKTLEDDDTLSLEQQATIAAHLAFIYWHEKQQLTQAETYFQRALTKIQAPNLKLTETNRGQLWFNLLLVYKEQNDLTRALIDIHEKTTTAIVKNNSYVYYAFIFRALLKADQTDWEGALTYICQAFETLTLPETFYEAMEMMLAPESTLQQRYEQLKALALEIHRFNMEWAL